LALRLCFEDKTWLSSLLGELITGYLGTRHFLPCDSPKHEIEKWRKVKLGTGSGLTYGSYIYHCCFLNITKSSRMGLGARRGGMRAESRVYTKTSVHRDNLESLRESGSL
jgi:hypothetical protein